MDELRDLSRRIYEIETAVAAMQVAVGEIAGACRRMERTIGEMRQFGGPFGIALGHNEILTQSLYELQYILPADDVIITPKLVCFRQWEPEMSLLMLRLAPAGSVFVDIGANFGYFTILVGDHMKQAPGSKIIAVEPNPPIVGLLRRNIAINWSMPEVVVVPKAVADATGRMVLTVPGDRAANASLARDAAGSSTNPEGDRRFEVDVITIDDLLRDEPRVDLIKIDVEGFEPTALRGAAETLARPGIRWICEWSQEQLQIAGFAPAELPAIFRAAGYRIYDAERYLVEGEGAVLDDECLLATDYLNLLAIRPE